MNNFKKALKTRGVTVLGASKKGVSYQTAYKHFHGGREVSAEAAILYEEKLGIPRHELRPDLWPQPVTVKQPQPTEA